MDIEKRINNDDNETGKFIQAYLFENGIKEPVIRRGFSKHKNLLKNLLNEFELPFELKQNGIPAEKKDGIYEFIGAGRFDILKDGRIGLSGKSVDYWIGLDVEHIRNIAKYFPKTFVEIELPDIIINEF